MKRGDDFVIVTPNYNMGAYLKRTIESVILNLRPGDQYFIIDGGSTDNSVEIIRSYEAQLTGWVSETDTGYADAIAKGFKLSSNNYMCWINSGDLLLEGALDRARDILSTTHADMIFGDDFYIDDEDKIISHSYGNMHSLKSMMLYGGWTPLQDACFWRRELYNSAGGLDERVKHAADYDLFLRMSMKGRCEYAPIVFSAFRKHEGQKSIQGRKEYKRERYLCRAMALRNSGYPWVKGHLLSTLYWFIVRFRSRIFRNYYQTKLHAGESIYAWHAVSICRDD